MKTVRTIIVEDEQLAMENLVFKIHKNCPQIEIVAQCLTGESAVKAIHEHEPELVLLDVELGTMKGFDVLDRLPHLQFEVIFTTHFDEYAIDAINAYEPLYYLLKPVNEKKLVEAIKKAGKKIDEKHQAKKQILLHFQEKIEPVSLDQIVFCKADNTYTEVYLADGGKKLVSQTLKTFTGRLPEEKFCRIHKSYTVNIRLIGSISKEDGKLYCIMRPKGEKLPVAPDRKNYLLNNF